MSLDMLGDLAYSLLFFFSLITTVSLFERIVFPRLVRAKGPVNQYGSLHYFISHYFFQIQFRAFENKRDQFQSIFTFTVFWVILTLLPLSSKYNIYFTRLDVLIMVLYILGRLVAPIVNQDWSKFREIYIDKSLTAAFTALLILGVIGLLKGGGANIVLIRFHFWETISFSKAFLFVLLFYFSENFYLIKPANLNGVNFIFMTYELSRVAWFAILIWTFVGSIEGVYMNSILYFVTVSGLIILKDIQQHFFGKRNPRLRAVSFEKAFVPAMLLGIILVWIEGVVFHAI